jgi:hypothetical protein
MNKLTDRFYFNVVDDRSSGQKRPIDVEEAPDAEKSNSAVLANENQGCPMMTTSDPKTAALDAALHFHIVQGLLKDGSPPSEPNLSRLAAVEPAAVRAGLQRIEADHGIVCHPGTSTPWVVHPFSLTPTATWVHSGKRGWWAP